MRITRQVPHTDEQTGPTASDAPWPVSARNLLSMRERSFYEALSSVYPDYKIFVQVALSQLIDVPKDHPDRHSIRARYKQLVADFVLCTSNLSIIAVIEVDDRTHLWPSRQKADARKNKVLADAGIRLVRIPAGRLPDRDRLRALIEADRPVSECSDALKLHASPSGGIELELAESEWVGPPNLFDDEERVYSETRRAGMRLSLGAVVVMAAWFMYSQLLMRSAPTIVNHHAAPVAASPASMRLQTVPSVAAAVSIQPMADEGAQKAQLAYQAAAALIREKDAAWAAYYTAPLSCEHPPTWADQVECGNRFMRAKKAFELQWTDEHKTVTSLPVVRE